MGLPRVLADRPIATAAHTPDGTFRATGLALEIPNPHVVVPVPDVATLAALDLTRAPDVDPALPHGQNVEFVVRRGERHLQLRVHERGVGETRSCGTGVCAAAVAAAITDAGDAGRTGGDDRPWRVDVPGGTCEVVWQPDGEVLLSGPAVLVADLEVDGDWLRAATAAH